MDKTRKVEVGRFYILESLPNNSLRYKLKIGQAYKVAEIYGNKKSCRVCLDDRTVSGLWFATYRLGADVTEAYLDVVAKHALYEEQTNEEENMHKELTKIYDKSKDAYVVNKHLGAMGFHTTFMDFMVISKNKTDVLKEANRLEKLEEEKSK